MTTFLNGEPDDWIEKFKRSSIHFVCVASGGLTACDFVASTVGGMLQEQEVWPLTKRINRLGETGTFWPRLTLTAVPQFSFETRHAPEDLDSFLESIFTDVVRANNTYIKLPDLYVDLNNYGGHFDFSMALPIARQVLSNDHSISRVWFADELT